MNFDKVISFFEKEILVNKEFQILDLHYMPYAFGAGYKVYRIKGMNIKIAYSGKEDSIEIFSSLNHQKYPNATWKSVFNGNYNEFIQKGFADFIG